MLNAHTPGLAILEKGQVRLLLTDRHYAHPSFDDLFRYHAELQGYAQGETIDIHLLICERCRIELDQIRVEHPSANDLELFATNRLAAPKSEAVNLHLSRCNRCQDALASVRSEVSGIRGALRKDLEAATKPRPVGLGKSSSSPSAYNQGATDALFIDASTIFRLTTAIVRLASIPVGARDVAALRSLIEAQAILDMFLKSTAVPPALRQAANELDIAIEKTLTDDPPEHESLRNNGSIQLIPALKRFESRLSEQLDIVFFKEDLRSVLSPRLVGRLHFDPAHWRWLPQTAQRHWIEASLCIATGLSTAAVFHVIRAAEAVTSYYLSKLHVSPLENDLIGNLELLKENGAEERTLSLATHLAAGHANPILDYTYFPGTEAANDIFEIGRVFIRRILRDMERKGFYFRTANTV